MGNVVSKKAMDVVKRVFECEVDKAVKNQSTLYLMRGKDNIPFVGFIAYIDTAKMSANVMSFVLGDLPDYQQQLWGKAVADADERIREYIQHTNFIGHNVTNETVKGWIARELEREEKDMDSKMKEVDGEVDGEVRRKFFETFELGNWDETSELASIIANVMDIDRRCQTNKIFWDTPIFTVGDLEVRYTSPCREFETGCILVNERKGGMIGNWSELTEGSDDCELNIDELSAQMWSIIKKYYQKELDRVVNDMVADYDSYGPATFNVGNIQVPYMALKRELEDVFNSFAVEYDEKTGFATAVTIFNTETRPHF